MRIIAGIYKSRVLEAPKGIRPTEDRVRKALFDTLGDMDGVVFLELFAGSGAVGLEAVSRGAKEVVLVEQDRDSLAAIEKNIASLALSNCHVYPLEAERALKSLQKGLKRFDIVFMDPPYYKEEAKKTLQMIEACDILAPNGFLIAQHFKKDALPDNLGVLSLFRQSKYGDTFLSFYKHVPESNLSR